MRFFFINSPILFLFRQVINRQLLAKLRPSLLVSVFSHPCKLAYRLMCLSRLISSELHKLFNTHVVVEEPKGIQTLLMRSDQAAFSFEFSTSQPHRFIRALFGKKSLRPRLLAHFNRAWSIGSSSACMSAALNVHNAELDITPPSHVPMKSQNKEEWRGRRQASGRNHHLHPLSED